MYAVLPTPTTEIPIPVLSRSAFSWYNSTPCLNATDNLDSSALDNLKLFDLSFKLPVPISSMKEYQYHDRFVNLVHHQMMLLNHHKTLIH